MYTEREKEGKKEKKRKKERRKELGLFNGQSINTTQCINLN